MADLNYNHLRYFREVARDGTLTGAAARLNLSQSALSTQIRTLEARLGHDLFDRVGRSLVLTEVGRIALDHADRIFGTGKDLLAILGRTGEGASPLRVGAVSTLSRNFQMQFLAPLLTREDIRVDLRSGARAALLTALSDLALDVVLTTDPSGDMAGLVAHRIDEQPVSLHGVPARMAATTLADVLKQPLILPLSGPVRLAFDSLAARHGLTPHIVAEVEDMAMMRLLARSGFGVALAPSVVMADEIRQGQLVTSSVDLNLVETFYAITAQRNFPHPLLVTLLPG